MNNEEINKLRKRILYRCSYTGTKETDILYKKLILSKINHFLHNELIDLSTLFNEYSDPEILLFLTKKQKINKKFKNLLKKIIS
tara:strand:- start:125 stop:376 length:252 start_codon:yes stop_codon:yes gene_type:complete